MIRFQEFVIFRLLGVRPAGIFLNAIHIESWYQQVLLDCTYEPWDTNLPFTVRFEACRRIGVENDDDDQVLITSEPLDVIAMTLGKTRYRIPAVIHCVELEIVIEYGHLTVDKHALPLPHGISHG